MKRVVPLMGLAVGVMLASGCATMDSGEQVGVPSAGEYEHIKKFYTIYGDKGHYKFSNEYMTLFAARKQPKDEPGPELQAYCEHALKGNRNRMGPALLERRGPFQVCEVEGKPAFLFFNNSPDDSAGEVDRLIAEKRKDISDEDFLQYLSGKGYKPSPRRGW